MHKKRLYLLIGICSAFIVTILLLALFAANQQAQNQALQNQPRVEYAGNLACLPHKNAQPDAPQTLECAVGLQTPESKYYALKDMPDEYKYIEFSADIIVAGEVSQPATDDKYDTSGTIKVQTIEIVPSTD